MDSEWDYLWKDGNHILLSSDEDCSSLDKCLIFDAKDPGILIIEDERLARRLKEKMRSSGVPVVPKSQRPKGTSRAQQIVEEMSAAGKSVEEINVALKVLRDEDNAKWRQRRKT